MVDTALRSCRCAPAELGHLTCFSLDAHPQLLGTAVGRLGGSVLLFVSMSLKINCWTVEALLGNKWIASGFTVLWRRDIFSSDIESRFGMDWHIFESS